MTSTPRGARAYRALVRLYPREFRKEYADDLVALFADQCRDEPPVRVYARTALDLLITVPTRHLESPMHRRAPTTTALLYIALAVGGLAMTALSGSNLTAGSVGLVVAVVGVALAVTTWRREATAASVGARADWWKLTGGGVALVVGVLVAAEAGADAWYLGMAVLLAGFSLVLAGLLMAGLHLVRRRSSPLGG